MKALILGCGPAGLIAAHAAVTQGADILILSKNRKSFMKGAQYLHQPILGVPATMFQVDYQLWGTGPGYREKIYGRKWDGVVSPDELVGFHNAWDIRETYDALWEMYKGAIVDWEASFGSLVQHIGHNKPDLVVSSIPRPLLCHDGHTFRATSVWSSDTCWLPQDQENVVVCNGESSPAWYRASRINGFENTEWPQNAKPPVTPLWDVHKPIDHNCNCIEPAGVKFVSVGRYGEWKKGVLSHEAFGKTTKAIEEIRDDERGIRLDEMRY